MRNIRVRVRVRLRPNPKYVSQTPPDNLVPDTKVPCKKAVHTLVSGTKREDFRNIRGAANMRLTSGKNDIN